jgi:hypothetical protein
MLGGVIYTPARSVYVQEKRKKGGKKHLCLREGELRPWEPAFAVIKKV